MGLDGVELVLEIEESFETRIPDEVAEQIRTVRNLVDWLMANGHSMKANRMGRDQVLLEVRVIAADQMGIRLAEVGEESRFVEDLGMD